MNHGPHALLAALSLVILLGCSETKVLPLDPNDVSALATRGNESTPQSDDSGSDVSADAANTTIATQTSNANENNSENTNVNSDDVSAASADENAANADQSQACEAFEVSAPSNLKVVDQSSRTISLEWDNNDSGVPTSYRIAYQVRGLGDRYGGSGSTLYNTYSVVFEDQVFSDALINGGIVDVTVFARPFNFIPNECRDALPPVESSSLSVNIDSFSVLRERSDGRVLTTAANTSYTRAEDGSYLVIEQSSDNATEATIQRLSANFEPLNQLSISDVENYAFGDQYLYLINKETGSDRTDLLTVRAFDIPSLDPLWTKNLNGRAQLSGFPFEVYVDASDGLNILYPGLALRVSSDMQVSQVDIENFYTPSNISHLVFGFEQSALLIAEPDRQFAGIGVPTEYNAASLDYETGQLTDLLIPTATASYSSTSFPRQIIGWAQNGNIAYILGKEDFDYCRLEVECKVDITFPLTEPRFHSLMSIDIETGEVLNKTRFEAPVVGSGAGIYINGEIEFYGPDLATRFDAESLTQCHDTNFAGVRAFADASGIYAAPFAARSLSNLKFPSASQGQFVTGELAFYTR